MRQVLILYVGSLLLMAGLWLMGGHGRPLATTGEKTIEFWTYAGGGSAGRSTRFWRGLADRFEKENPGVRILTVTDIDQGNYVQMLSTRVIGGTPPDVLIMDDNMAVGLNEEGLIAPLDDFLRRDPTYHVEDFPASMMRDGRVAGTQYWIPWYGGSSCLMYRTDLFEQAGVSPPRTWQEFLDVCRTLQAKLNMPHPLAFDVEVAFWLMPWVWQNGGEILSPDHRKVLIDSPEFIEAVQFVHDLMYQHHFMDSGLARGMLVKDLWSAGKVAMIIGGTWEIGMMDDNYPQWKGRWEVAPLPAGRLAASFYGGQQLMMTRKCKYPELAWRFMVYATRPENQKLWTDITGSPPANLKTLEMTEFRREHAHFVRLKQAMLTGRNNPLAPFFAEIWYGRFSNVVLHRVMSDPNGDVAAAVREAVSQMQKIVDNYWASHKHFVQGE